MTYHASVKKGRKGSKMPKMPKKGHMKMPKRMPAH